MDRELLHRQFLNIRQATNNGIRAPHKPLLLLLMLGKLWVERKHQLVAYSDIEGPMVDLLNQFHVSKQHHAPDNLFKRLRTDGTFWELSNVADLPSGVISTLNVSELRRRRVAGGFNEDTVKFLLKKPSVILELARVLLEKHFPESFFADVCAMVNLPYPLNVASSLDTHTVESDRVTIHEQQKREPSFREHVLNAYERKCAFCGSATMLRNTLVDIEAAHIKWHCQGGPSTVSNGLALCVAHHKLFDRGAMGLKREVSSFHIVMAPALSSFGPSDALNKKLRGSSMQLPFNENLWPNPEFVEWHWDQVFQGP